MNAQEGKSMSKVDHYRQRRFRRLMSRLDAAEDKGHWITTENGHKVHLNEEGTPDKGNPHVIEKMAGGASAQISKLNERAQSLKGMKKAERLSTLTSLIDEMPVGSQVRITDGSVTAFKHEAVVTKLADGSFSQDTYRNGELVYKGTKWKPAALKYSDNKQVEYQFGESGSVSPVTPKPATVEPVSAPEPKKETPKTQNTPDAAAIQKAKEKKAKEAAKTKAMLEKAKAEQAKKDAISKIDKEIEDLEHEMYKAQHYGNNESGNESGNWDYSDECEAKIHELEAKKKKLLGK